MKTLHVEFEDKDFIKLVKKKNKSGLTWYAFIMVLTTIDFNNQKGVN